MNFDFSAYSQPVTKEDIKSYKAQYEKNDVYKTFSTKILPYIVVIPGVFIVALVAVSAFTGGLGPTGWIMPTIIFGIFLTIFLMAVVGTYNKIRRRAKYYKFARANNASLLVDQAPIANPGIVFNEGYARMIQEGFSMPNGWEIGNYTYVTGSGKSRTTHYWGYMRARLVRKLPHMVLDARSNNMFRSKLSNLPATFNSDQIIQLEGNFNEHFTLYGPKEYGMDARYVFTPDVMSALIDFGTNYDIEVIDDTLIFYAPMSINLDTEQSLRAAFTVLDKVSSEIIEQGDNYSDYRVGDRASNVIAEPGRRLKSRLSIFTIIGIVIFMAYFLWTFILDLMN